MNNCVWYVLGDCEVTDNKCLTCNFRVLHNTAIGKMIIATYKADLDRKVEVTNDRPKI